MSNARPRTMGSAVRRLIGLGAVLYVPAALPAQVPVAPDWRSDWAVAEGFSLRRDAEGFRFPTSIAFVPHPGSAPDDPLYFVTELQGTIKVVTNDRQVHTFATDVMSLTTRDTFPAQQAEVGLAGLCLEPGRGYVFATFAYTDSMGGLRNGMARFESRPGRFSLTPRSKVVFTRPFEPDVAAVSHQIGPCQATATGVYVSVGDGEEPKRSRDLQSTLGKILRLTLDGRPHPSNPYPRSGKSSAAAYVWASGLRNPFGLKVIGTRTFVADNGTNIDRFLEIERGKDYGWDGTDLSIGMNAPMINAPAVSPVQLDYCWKGTAGLPSAWANRFFVALSGTPRRKGTEDRRGKGVYVLHYGLQERRMLGVPTNLIQYRGIGYQAVVGLACGPDAVYVVSIFPDATGTTAVLAVKYDPSATYPYPLASDAAPLRLMDDKGCFGCHTLKGKGGNAGPPLDRDELVARLTQRLSSDEYRRTVEGVDSLPAEPFLSSRKARHAVLDVQGMDRVRLWMRHHIRQPKFDNPLSQMPALDVSDGEAVALTDFLLAPSTLATARAKPVAASRLTPKPKPKPKVRYRHVALALVVGLMLGGTAVWAAGRRWRNRRSDS
jgi:glucose/arabinose dehydrogenase